MASMVAENWKYVDGRGGSENHEFSEVNHNILMSLFDETQIDDCDDERLKNVIQSLEDEIGSGGRQYEFDSTVWECDLGDCQSSIDETNDHERMTQHDDLDFHWMDMESLPTSPSWDMYSHGKEMVGGVNEFGWFKDYAPICSVTPFEEQDYGSLWHEINVTM